MSFALTTQQVRDQSKTVTRRMGWAQLKPADFFQPVVKCMGLRKGEKVEPIGGPVVVVSMRREPLRRMIDELRYGIAECALEGFPQMTAPAFVDMFCATHKNCTPETLVTRIEFSYEDGP